MSLLVIAAQKRALKVKGSYGPVRFRRAKTVRNFAAAASCAPPSPLQPAVSREAAWLSRGSASGKLPIEFRTGSILGAAPLVYGRFGLPIVIHAWRGERPVGAHTAILIFLLRALAARRSAVPPDATRCIAEENTVIPAGCSKSAAWNSHTRDEAVVGRFFLQTTASPGNSVLCRRMARLQLICFIALLFYLAPAFSSEAAATRCEEPPAAQRFSRTHPS